MDNVENALEKFPEKKIFVIGDVFLDEFCWGEIERVNPEQPAAHLIKIYKKSHTLGGAGNVANNISSLGGSCDLYGVLKEDHAGKKIKELCKKNKIDLKVFYNGQPTIVKQRFYAHGQQISRCDYGESQLSKLNENLEKEILDFLEKEIGKANMIVLSDYNKYLFRGDFAKKIIQIANLKNIPIIVDPKPENIDSFKNCTLIRPNKIDAERITGVKYENGKKRLKEMAEKLSEKINSRYSVITCAGDGAFCYDKEKNDCLLIETKAREVLDVTGAGDTFVAMLALAISSDLSLFDAVKLANYASGVVIEKAGTAVVNIDEIKRRICEDKV